MIVLAAATGTLENLVPTQMITLGILVLAAHLGGRLFDRFKLSVVTGQLLGGVLMGPWALRTLGIMPDGAAYQAAVESFSFVIFIFVSVVAFSIGEELHLDRLRHVGKSALVICLIQVLTSFTFVASGLYFIGRIPLISALVVGTMGIVTAPSLTYVILNRLRIEGRMRSILGSVEILGDVLGVMIFSLLIQVGEKQMNDPAAFDTLPHSIRSLSPVLINLLLAHLIGLGIYLLLRVLVRRRRKQLIEPEFPEDSPSGLLGRMLAEHPSPSAQIFLIVVSAVAIGAGLAHHLHLPFLATSAFAGFLVANFHSHTIFDSLKIENIASLFNLTFFALIGATVSFDAFDGRTAMLVLIYVSTRALGKISGIWLGCKIMREDRKIASCLPYLLFPQAAVAAIESVYAATLLREPVIAAIMLPSIVIFEVGGVLMSERTLKRWRSWVSGEEEALRQDQKPQPSPAPAIERLLSVLSEDTILLDLDTPTKGSTVRSLVEHADRVSEQHFDVKEAVQLIGERERLMPTGMGHGIAIPHCRMLALDTPIVIYARHAKGVVFGGVDDRPCHLIVLILSGSGSPDEHLRLLGATAQLLGVEETRQTLLTAPTATQFLDTIRQAAEPAASPL